MKKIVTFGEMMHSLTPSHCGTLVEIFRRNLGAFIVSEDNLFGIVTLFLSQHNFSKN